MTPHTPLRSTAKPKPRPGPRKQPVAAVSRWIPPPAATPSKPNAVGRLSFKLGVLSWAHYTEVDNGNGGTRKPTIEEIWHSRMGIRYQSGEWYSVKLLLRNSIPDLQLIFTLIQEASLLQAREKTQRIRAKHPVYNAVPEGQCGALGGKLRTTTYRQIRKINPYIQGQVLLQGKVIYGLGGRGKAAVEKYSLQVLLSFRCPQVNKTAWGSEVVVPALRRGNRKKPKRNYVVSFPAITDAEHDEDDGNEYCFCWAQDGC
jgi:hypothetical protein